MSDSDLKEWYEEEYFKDPYIKILFGINILLLIIYKYVFVAQLRSFDLKKDGERTTPSDYTVLVKGIENDSSSNEVIKYFEETVPGITVVKVNFVHKISELYDATTKLLEYNKKYVILKKKGEHETNWGKKIKEVRDTYKKDFEQITQEFYTEEGFKKNFTGFAFVTLKNKKEARKLVKKTNLQFFACSFTRGKYKVKRANEPGDVVWKNFGLTLKEKLLRRALSLFVSLLIIGASFGIILGIKFFHKNELEEILRENKLTGIYFSYAISVLISFVIICINFMLRKIMRILSDLERRTTFTTIEREIVFKISILYFINTAVVNLVASIVITNSSNDNETETNYINNKIFWGAGGVVATVMTISVISVFGQALYDYFNPWYALKVVKRAYYRYKIKNQGNSNKILQIEVNQSYEGYRFDVSEKYYIAFKTISVAFFFQSIMPYLLLFAIAEFMIMYWVQKTVLVQRCNRSKDLDFKFSAGMTRNFEMMTFILALGYCTMESLATGSISPFTIAIIVITGWEWLIFHVSILVSCCRKEQADREDELYENVSKNFFTDYDRMNPVTQEKATKAWLINNGYVRSAQRIPSTKNFQEIGERPQADNLTKNLIDYVKNFNLNGIENQDIAYPEFEDDIVPDRGYQGDDIGLYDLYRIANDAENNELNMIYNKNQNRLRQDQGFFSILPTKRNNDQRNYHQVDDVAMLYPIDIFNKQDQEDNRQPFMRNPSLGRIREDLPYNNEYQYNNNVPGNEDVPLQYNDNLYFNQENPGYNNNPYNQPAYDNPYYNNNDYRDYNNNNK